jgi:hypothetical protein
MEASIALYGVIASLMRVLHKNKVIDIEDVVVDLGNTIDFAKATHMDADLNQDYLIVLYKQLQQLSAALKK